MHLAQLALYSTAGGEGGGSAGGGSASGVGSQYTAVDANVNVGAAGGSAADVGAAGGSAADVGAAGGSAAGGSADTLCGCAHVGRLPAPLAHGSVRRGALALARPSHRTPEV